LERKGKTRFIISLGRVCLCESPLSLLSSSSSSCCLLLWRLVNPTLARRAAMMRATDARRRRRRRRRRREEEEEGEGKGGREGVVTVVEGMRSTTTSGCRAVCAVMAAWDAFQGAPAADARRTFGCDMYAPSRLEAVRACAVV
jgi:hypothetical protein